MKKPAFMLFGMIDHKKAKEDSLADFAEAMALVETYGGTVTEIAYQQDNHLDQTYYIGKGKNQEILEILKKNKIGYLVINDTVKPTQLYALKEWYEKEIPEIEIWDRVDLILNIFSRHASTAEAKLQIKLAEIRHMGPILYGMGMMLSRQGGGIGTRGLGETNTEIEQRHFKAAIKQIQINLDKVMRNRMQQIDSRKKLGLTTIALVGYTNAGKTTLFNRLTKKTNLVADALFATLDSSIGKVYLPDAGQEILLTDTIGFIQNLPLQLIEAFKSTLLETVQADLIVEVVDAGDPQWDLKMLVVAKVLKDLGLEKRPMIIAMNKIDQVEKLNRAEIQEKYPNWELFWISAKKDLGIDQLKARFQAVKV